MVVREPSLRRVQLMGRYSNVQQNPIPGGAIPQLSAKQLFLEFLSLIMQPGHFPSRWVTTAMASGSWSMDRSVPVFKRWSNGLRMSASALGRPINIGCRQDEGLRVDGFPQRAPVYVKIPLVHCLKNPAYPWLRQCCCRGQGRV